VWQRKHPRNWSIGTKSWLPTVIEIFFHGLQAAIMVSGILVIAEAIQQTDSDIASASAAQERALQVTQTRAALPELAVNLLAAQSAQPNVSVASQFAAITRHTHAVFAVGLDVRGGLDVPGSALPVSALADVARSFRDLRSAVSALELQADQNRRPDAVQRHLTWRKATDAALDEQLGTIDRLVAAVQATRDVDQSEIREGLLAADLLAVRAAVFQQMAAGYQAEDLQTLATAVQQAHASVAASYSALIAATGADAAAAAELLALGAVVAEYGDIIQYRERTNRLFPLRRSLEELRGLVDQRWAGFSTARNVEAATTIGAIRSSLGTVDTSIATMVFNVKVIAVIAVLLGCAASAGIRLHCFAPLRRLVHVIGSVLETGGVAVPAAANARGDEIGALERGLVAIRLSIEQTEAQSLAREAAELQAVDAEARAGEAVLATVARIAGTVDGIRNTVDAEVDRARHDLTDVLNRLKDQGRAAVEATDRLGEVSTELAVQQESFETLSRTFHGLVDRMTSLQELNETAQRHDACLGASVSRISAATQEIGSLTVALTKTLADGRLLALNARIAAHHAGDPGFEQIAQSTGAFVDVTAQGLLQLDSTLQSLRDDLRAVDVARQALDGVSADVNRQIRDASAAVTGHSAKMIAAISGVARAQDSGRGALDDTRSLSATVAALTSEITTVSQALTATQQAAHASVQVVKSDLELIRAAHAVGMPDQQPLGTLRFPLPPSESSASRYPAQGEPNHATLALHPGRSSAVPDPRSRLRLTA
jgi:hypothetical protein